MPTYHLIDSGDGEKLEQFGDFVLRRPDPQALYPKRLPVSEWDKAHATFGSFLGKGKWKKNASVLGESAEIPETWPVTLGGLTFSATLACVSAGAQVVHVDASKGIVDVANQNAKLSNLGDKPIRWIVDDVKKFVARELSRGNSYEAIIMDPPSYGHGPKKEV